MGRGGRRQAVGQGTFGLENWIMTLKLRPVDAAQMPPELMAILGQSPWIECAEIAGIGRAVGFARQKKSD